MPLPVRVVLPTGHHLYSTSIVPVFESGIGRHLLRSNLVCCNTLPKPWLKFHKFEQQTPHHHTLEYRYDFQVTGKNSTEHCYAELEPRFTIWTWIRWDKRDLDRGGALQMLSPSPATFVEQMQYGLGERSGLRLGKAELSLSLKFQVFCP